MSSDGKTCSFPEGLTAHSRFEASSFVADPESNWLWMLVAQVLAASGS